MEPAAAWSRVQKAGAWSALLVKMKEGLGSVAEVKFVGEERAKWQVWEEEGRLERETRRFPVAGTGSWRVGVLTSSLLELQERVRKAGVRVEIHETLRVSRVLKVRSWADWGG